MSDQSSRSRSIRFVLVALAVTVSAGALVAYDWWSAVPNDVTAKYVGGQSCAECHQAEHTKWQGSHHDLAMDVATEETVLGDFSGVSLEHYGIMSTMFRNGAGYFVNTEGPDGKMTDFEVKYVFGVEPLQQYMVEFDRADGMPDNQIGRLQVLRITWDTIKKEWFYLSPPDVDEKLAPNDPLHWTRAGQNWNHMCASCHSTNLQKNFDVATRTYHTTFSEIDVSCEACHGPGSVHVGLAKANSLFWDRKLGYGLRRIKGQSHKAEVETCAPCHARRRNVCPDQSLTTSFYDNYVNELLRPETYYADGQIKDEVYVFGSFIQSKMYHKEIKCSDCHDPHTARLKHEGNAVCTSCHQHPAAKYDHSGHHHHTAGSTGSSCIACHMPETPYMEIDLRADHSLRIPRPDLSVTLNTPNACTGCHLEKNNVAPEKHDSLTYYSDWLAARNTDAEIEAEIHRVDEWCSDWVSKWYESPRPDHYGTVLASAWNGDASSVAPLRSIIRSRANPAIVRASALLQLGQVSFPDALELAKRMAKDEDPQLRITSAGILEFAQGETALADILQNIEPLLFDPVASVRIEAARILAAVGMPALQPASRDAFDRAIEAYRRGLLADSDQAAAHLSLGILEERFAQAERSAARLEKAAEHYRNAIRVQPDVTGPRSNLAGVLEQLGKPPEQIAKLRAQELKLLERDAKLATDVAVVQYRYGLALYLNKKLEESVRVIRRACQLAPESVEYRYMLTGLLQRLGRYKEALVEIERLIQLQPHNQSFQGLKAQLQQQASSQ